MEPGPEPDIFYWKDKKEIDFVLPIKRRLIPIESKYRSKIPNESVEAVKRFIKEKNSPFGIIITKDEFGLKDSILKIPLWVFLLIIWGKMSEEIIDPKDSRIRLYKLKYPEEAVKEMENEW